jgi:hypothetical protein
MFLVAAGCSDAAAVPQAALYDALLLVLLCGCCSASRHDVLVVLVNSWVLSSRAVGPAV